VRGENGRRRLAGRATQDAIGHALSFVTGQTLIVDGGLAITDYTSMNLLNKVGYKLFSGKL